MEGQAAAEDASHVEMVAAMGSFVVALWVVLRCNERMDGYCSFGSTSISTCCDAKCLFDAPRGVEMQGKNGWIL